MYIRRRQELIEELAGRRERRQEIQKRRDAFIQQQYGIDFFSDVVAHYWSLPIASAPTGMLCRQVASIMIEDVACYLGCRSLGLSAWAGELTCDGFYTVNADKQYRVKIPWLRWGKKGNPVVKYECLSTMPFDQLEGMCLANVPTQHGVLLPEWHHQRRQLVFGDTYPTMDMSGFFRDCLQLATKRPGLVYLGTDDGYEIPVSFEESLPKQSCRPPAAWYYPLYFSLFLDGSLVLLESYDDATTGNVHVKALFESTMEQIASAVGVLPLVTCIPSLTKETRYLLYYNKHLLDSRLTDFSCEELAEEQDLLQLFFTAADIGYRSCDVVFSA